MKRGGIEMKRIMLYVILLLCFMLFPIGVQADTITITDPAGDQIGGSGFDTTKIVYNVDSYPLVLTVTITTNYTEAGINVGGWQTLPADLILWGEQSSPPAYAIPLVDHDGFTAGTLYTVGSMYTSDEMAASYGATSPPFTWGFGEYVWLKTGTDDYGFTGSVSWGAPGVTYTANNWYWNTASPPGDFLKISWATSTCANDVVGGPVPIPPAILLLGSGLVGLLTVRRRKHQR